MKWREVRVWIGGCVLWGTIALCVGIMSDARLQVLPDEMTEMQLVIRYSGKLLGECQAVSGVEMEELAPNMRRAMVCPREKSPVYAELRIGGKLYFRDTIMPSGLHNDGVVAAYAQIPVRTGTAMVSLRVRDDRRVEGFTHTFEQPVELGVDSVVTIHFDDQGIRMTGTDV